MFDLVADVESYPQFVPLCRSLAVRKRTTDSAGRDVIVADMTVAYKFVRETFTSRVTLDRPKLEILVEYLEGPFERMNNRWSFRAHRRAQPPTSNFSSPTNFAAAPLACSWAAFSTLPFAVSPRPSSAAPIRFMAPTRLEHLTKARKCAVAGQALIFRGIGTATDFQCRSSGICGL